MVYRTQLCRGERPFEDPWDARGGGARDDQGYPGTPIKARGELSVACASKVFRQAPTACAPHCSRIDCHDGS